MFPKRFRIPRRWKVLFWRLSDRLRKPSAEPLPVPVDDRLDEPTYQRRSTRR